MKILQFGKAFPPVNLGGVEVVIKLLTEGLNKSGHECDALGVNDHFEFTLEKGRFGGKIFRTKLVLKAFSTLISFQLIKVFNNIKNNYDIIHLHSPDPMAALAVFLCRPKKIIVLHWHSDILKQKLLLFFYTPILNWLLNRADLVIATSPNYALGSKYLQKRNAKVRIVPIGLNIRKQELGEIFKSSMKDVYGDKKIIFSLGRLAYYKGFEYLVKASIHLPDDHIIIIAGEGNERKMLTKLIIELGVEHKVKLLGKVTEAEKQWFFQHCAIFALSSIFKTEAYAIVQVEAMAYGIPIVSTVIPGSGVDWVNQNDLTGISVPIMNEEALAKAILHILSNEVLYNNFKLNALSRYDNLFTEERMINNQMAVYEELLHIGE